jgi:hypothetical protein
MKMKDLKLIMKSLNHNNSKSIYNYSTKNKCKKNSEDKSDN